RLRAELEADGAACSPVVIRCFALYQKRALAGFSAYTYPYLDDARKHEVAGRLVQKASPTIHLLREKIQRFVDGRIYFASTCCQCSYWRQHKRSRERHAESGEHTVHLSAPSVMAARAS